MTSDCHLVLPSSRQKLTITSARLVNGQLLLLYLLSDRPKPNPRPNSISKRAIRTRLRPELLNSRQLRGSEPGQHLGLTTLGKLSEPKSRWGTEGQSGLKATPLEEEDFKPPPSLPRSINDGFRNLTSAYHERRSITQVPQNPRRPITIIYHSAKNQKEQSRSSSRSFLGPPSLLRHRKTTIFLTKSASRRQLKSGSSRVVV